MELFYVYTCNGRIFYTSISLNDRFKQYQTSSPVEFKHQDYRGYEAFSSVDFRQDYHGYQAFNPVRYRQDYPGYFPNRAPKRRRNVIYESLNRFEKAPVIWDSNFYEHSSLWTFFRESPWNSFDQQEPEIYMPVSSTKKNKKKRRKRMKKQARRALTRQELDDELDQYMINIQ